MAGEILEPVAVPLRIKFSSAANQLRKVATDLRGDRKKIIMSVVKELSSLPFGTSISLNAEKCLSMSEILITLDREEETTSELFFDTLLASTIKLIRKSLAPDWGIDRSSTKYLLEQQAEMLIITARAYSFKTLTDFYSSIIPEIQNEQ